MRHSSHRLFNPVILIYLLVIVCPTLALLYLGRQSIETQRQALARLSASNRLLNAENFGRDVEQRVETLVSECFRDPAFLKLPRDITPSLELARRFRTASEQFKKAHPIADHLFVIDGGEMSYPVLHTLGRGVPKGGGRCF